MIEFSAGFQKLFVNNSANKVPLKNKIFENKFIKFR